MKTAMMVEEQTDYFTMLGVPRQADLNEEDLREAYQQRARRIHPDLADSETERERLSSESTRLNHAWATLRDPVARLRYLHSLLAPGEKADAGLDEDLMNLFVLVGEAVRKADSVLARKRKATSSLARALLLEDEMQAQEGLQNALGEVSERILQLSLDVQEPEEIRKLYTRMSFLEKWRRQLNEKLLTLIEE